MQPQIQYAKTSDGVSIAYYAIGQGPALLMLILPPSQGKQFMFADLGETELRGFEDPVRLYELRWREEG